MARAEPGEPEPRFLSLQQTDLEPVPSRTEPLEPVPSRNDWIRFCRGAEADGPVPLLNRLKRNRFSCETEPNLFKRTVAFPAVVTVGIQTSTFLDLIRMVNLSTGHCSRALTGAHTTVL